MNKFKDLNIPVTLNKYTLEQANRLFNYITSEREPDLDPKLEKINIVHAVTGIDVEHLRYRYSFIQCIQPAYEIITKALRYKIKEPAAEININGQVYVFEKDIAGESWNAGRLIDADNRSIDVSEQPEYMCAICYLEKGKHYGWPESEGGCMPLPKRAELMRAHFNGEDYLNLYAFFLRKFYQLSPGFSVLQIAKAQIQRKEAEKLMHPPG